MPVNMLRKDIPKGQKPPGCSASSGSVGESAAKENEFRAMDLSRIEEQTAWESQDFGIVRWSGENDNRFSDPGA